MTLLWATHLISLQNGKSKERGRRVDAIDKRLHLWAPAVPLLSLHPAAADDAHVGDTDAASSVQSKVGAGIAGAG